MKKILLCLVIIFPFLALGQQKELLKVSSLVKNIYIKNIGPTIMSGRVVDVDVNPNDPTEFYVGYATGGLWYTNNNGTSFTSLLDGTPTQNIGDIAVNWKSGIIWVGTGENNASRSSYAGIGILKSTDKGNTWQHMGLEDSHHIGRIILNPSNPNEVIVGAVGHLYTTNNDRGVYKTTNGGKTWIKTLYINDNTGIIDIAHSPTDFNIQYAAAWQKDRKAWHFNGSGTGSGIYKSMNGGISWEKISNPESGFPKGLGIGRIGLAVFDNNIVYAIVDNQDRRKKKSEKPSVIGAEVYRSNNGGKTWGKTNKDLNNNLFYGNGYYFGQIRVSTSNKEHIYLGGVPLLKSKDGGKTFNSINKENVHADHHALWINPKMPKHIITGNDGGINISYDDGKTWTKNNSTSVGQFYTINIDHQDPYNVYGGLQDNGVWKGAHNAQQDNKWQQTGHNPWTQIIGGDGMHIQIDKRNPNIVYTGFQFGNYFRIDLEKNKRYAIQPKNEEGEASYRFNWQTPILLSEHNQDVLYLGGNKLHRSLNQGEDWETISDDLTQGEKQGNVSYGTLTTISESPFQHGLLYTGSDDGLVHITKNGGESWEQISKNIPLNKDKTNLWVSSIEASKHKKERVYVALNGYRSDDFTPYLYVSNNHGKTWRPISKGIPKSPVNVILEDPENENLLFVGTDSGLHVSFNQGASWEIFQNGMPNVPVHDLVIQPKAKHLLIGTHGRSIYKADISVLQQFTAKIIQKELHLFKTASLKYSKNWGNPTNTWAKPNTPGIDITFYTLMQGTYHANIKTMNGTEVSSTNIDADKGLNILSYDIAFSKTGKSNYLKKNKRKLTVAKDGKTYLPKGRYIIEISGNGTIEKIEFEIE